MTIDIIQQTMQSFFRTADPSNVHTVAKGLTELGLFEAIPFEDFEETLLPMLQHVARFDANLAVSILAHHFSDALLRLCVDTDPTEPIYTTAVFATLDEISSSIRTNQPLLVPYLGKVALTVVLPVRNAACTEVIVSSARNIQSHSTISGATSHAAVTYEDLLSVFTYTISSAEFDLLHSRFQSAAAAIALGLMEGALLEVERFCEQRFQGGKQLKDWSQVQMQISELRIEICVHRELFDSLKCADSRFSQSKQMAIPLHILQCVVPFVDRALKVLGGFGYIKDFPQEKRFRDSFQVQSLFGRLDFKKMNFFLKDKP